VVKQAKQHGHYHRVLMAIVILIAQRIELLAKHSSSAAGAGGWQHRPV
jgi:hypothetical protein